MTFQKDLEVGKVGENIAKKIIADSPQTKCLIDTANDPYFQQKDIDFIQLKNNGLILKYEVKTDRLAHKTGNICYEVTTSHNIGCLEKTEANYILYYLCESKEMYGFWIKDLRKYIYKKVNDKELQLIDMGDAATGYLLSIKDLLQKKIIQRIEVKNEYIE